MSYYAGFVWGVLFYLGIKISECVVEMMAAKRVEMILRKMAESRVRMEIDRVKMGE